MPQDYNSTLNLPQTDFPMRGNLPKREPDMLAQWEENRPYYALCEKNKEKPKYILHDGPPYANGDIHMGTALNKVLKDIIVKYKAMTGYNAVYVPGWDCHGLPIELKAIKDLGVDSNADTATIRENCRKFALSYLDNQKVQFKRLGVWGDFDNPYLTINHEFEANQVKVFGEMYKKGYIYKGLKPVYWCADCKTALAEAEIEYEDDENYSIFVAFKVTDDKGIFSGIGVNPADVSVVIWTTTTWTLPGNLAICLGPVYDYTLVRVEQEDSKFYGKYLLMAAELAPVVMKSVGIEKFSTHGSFKGKDLEFVETEHPFMGRKSPLIVGNHVTLESGTGCVHTAPGFGVEDFEVCNSYKGMFKIVVPVDSKGIMTEEAGKFAGLKTDAANKAISKDLEESGSLLAVQKISHSYPHCWRCHNPIIYRATDQIFCAVDKFKDETLKAITEVQWIPKWGEDRIRNMVADRSDWCISRQRIWGVPIPILYNKATGEPIVTDDTIEAISDLFRRESSDAWYRLDANDILPQSVKDKLGVYDFEKETDIFDVWFDSGCSHEAVLREREELHWPADLYLEGADQYRGWFQSSLLTSVACYGTAPYKAVCTHGWVLAGKGEKMSKSKGNVIVPADVIKQYGADVLRLWVASLDYHNDVRVSDDILKQVSEAYRKIRNTARFMLGNLCNGEGFDPNTDMVDLKLVDGLDKWALNAFDKLIEKVKTSYEAMDYYLAYHAIHNFCVVDMSNFYLDVIKDRLYCENEKSQQRRVAQSVMYTILHGLTLLVAPILSFTADEIWEYIPHLVADDKRGAAFNEMPEKTGIVADEEFIAKWDKIHAIREDVQKVLEIKRGENLIGKSLEAKVILHSNEDLSVLTDDFDKIFIVSQVEFDGGEGEFKGDVDGLSITVTKADGEKCERCWTYSEYVGKDSKHPTLCERCAKAVEGV